MNVIFLGIGSGRCGTASLSRIISACRNTRVTHECSDYRSPWYKIDPSKFAAFVADANTCSKTNTLFGDIAPYWLPHISKIKDTYPALKVICMKRSKSETVRSFLKKCPGYSQLRLQDRHFSSEWWQQFPTIESPTIQSAWEFYWDFYYSEVDKLTDVFMVETKDLNLDRCIEGIFDYLGISTEDRVFISRRKFNSIYETEICLPVSH